MAATRWGIVSTGAISYDFAAAIRSCDPTQHEITAVGARKLQSALDFGKKFDIKKCYGSYEQIAQDSEIDIVYIGTVNTCHAMVCKMMINAGKRVICEKPLTLNVKQSQELFKIAKEKKVFFMEGFWTSFFPIIAQLREELSRKSIGEPRVLTVNFGQDMVARERLIQKELGGGGLLDLGCYNLLLARLVFPGATLERVVASGTLADTGVDTFVAATLYFDQGRVAQLLITTTCKLDNEMTICGTNGKYLKMPMFWCPTELFTPSGVYKIPLPTSGFSLNHGNSEGMQYEVQAVRNSLLKGELENSLVTHADSLWIMGVMDEIRKQIGVHFDVDDE